jgi:hypothetical protein
MRIEPTKFYCYLRGTALKELLDHNTVLDLLIEELSVPVKPAHLKRMSKDDKIDAIERTALDHQEHPKAIWYGVSVPEILAGALLRSKTRNRYVAAVSYRPKRDAELEKPVASWLVNRGVRVYSEVPTGTKRADMIGYKKGGVLSTAHVVIVELKNSIDQLKRALDQMTTFGEYAHEVYLGCSSAMAAEYVTKHASANGVEQWDPEVLNNKLRSFGFGLLLVSGETHVDELLAPKGRVPQRAKARELGNRVDQMREFVIK